MMIISKTDALRDALNTARSEGRSIGLIPTMGALHRGHLSLIETSVSSGDFVVVSIFVNPTQFNDPKDLERYPRDLNADLKLLDRFPVDIVFAPSVEEMYPEEDTRKFDLAPLDRIMEGKHRPGHFNGVAQIVSKLFYAISPDRAYFGQKDFQQLAIIKKLVALLNLNIDIIGCPIIREDDGLAMSSRNQLLVPEERAAAPLINKTLEKAAKNYTRYSSGEVRDQVIKEINQHPLMKVEYFDIVDDQTLISIRDWNESKNKIACIAVQLGSIRLIDNRYFD